MEEYIGGQEPPRKFVIGTRSSHRLAPKIQVWLIVEAGWIKAQIQATIANAAINELANVGMH